VILRRRLDEMRRRRDAPRRWRRRGRSGSSSDTRPLSVEGDRRAQGVGGSNQRTSRRSIEPAVEGLAGIARRGQRDNCAGESY